MSNLNTAAAAVNGDPQTIEIKGTRYAVARIEHGPDGTAAYRLVKLGGKNEVYDVLRTHFGLIECTCPHYELRLKGNTVASCKHGDALVKAGLLEAPAFDAGNPQPAAIDLGDDDATELAVDFEIPAAAAGETITCEVIEPTEEDWADYWQFSEAVDASEPEPSEPLLPFADWIETQAAYFRSLGTEAAAWLAGKVDDLAADARFMGARGPESYEDRKAAYLDCRA